MAILTPDFGLLFWMLLSFGIVFFILAKAGFPVIVRMVEKRRTYIEESLKAADEANRRMEGIKEESQQIIGDAHRRQAEIIKKAIAEGEKIVQNAQVRAAAEADKGVEVARQRIEAEKAKVMSEINTQIAMISVDIAEKVLRHKLTDSEHQQALIMRMLDEGESIRRNRPDDKKES